MTKDNPATQDFNYQRETCCVRNYQFYQVMEPRRISEQNTIWLEIAEVELSLLTAQILVYIQQDSELCQTVLDMFVPAKL